MQRIYHSLLFIVVATSLTGCFFFQKREVARWEIAPQGSTSFALSRDGRFGLLYATPQALLLWDLVANQPLAKLGPQDSQHSVVSHIQFSDNGRYAVTASQNNFAVWDLAFTQAKGLWSIADGVIRDIDIASDGQQILLGLSNGKAIFVNLVTGVRMEFLAHAEKVNSVALSANGRYALTGGNDHFAYLWDTKTGQILKRFEHNQRVVRVALQRDGTMAFTADGGNTATLWPLEASQETQELKSWSRQLIFSSARFSDDGSLLVTGSPSGEVVVWQTASGEQMERFSVEPLKDARPARAVVYDAAFDSQHRVISASSAGIAQAWPLEKDYD
ncbi:hypothetical protein HGP28_17500 [Vibrio sp. SM6]|uniref:Lipoprotein n=1 Tax=Vibrio agarilyticus TaxID=2726741 RepID=A0A7X8TTS7_9VIBR|nr:hypothetical protein [Vibrio agarilyticus]NLS14658.1 hypothetical protein [Vibrio agarilyticus]